MMVVMTKGACVGGCTAMTIRERRTYWTAAGILLLATLAIGLMAAGGGKAATKSTAPPPPEVGKTGEQSAQQEQLVAALRDATRLSTDRYQGGLDSYLQVLDAQRNLFRSELDLTTLQRQELTSIVELYRALGGGWNQ